MKSALATINFETTLYTLDSWIILPVPEEESVKLSSRGQLSVKGLVNGHEFKTVLEPDGRWSHWMRIDEKLQSTAKVQSGDVVAVEMTQIKEWPEPEIPQDLAKALAAAPEKIQQMWKDITPMARWEWIRWVNATANQETRAGRVEKTIGKMKSGKRRPCCFNLAACTDPYLSKSGRLKEPSTVA